MNPNPFATKFVRMKFPPDTAPEIAISGHQLQADEDGWCEVPPNLVEQCQAHGLVTEAALKAEADKIAYLARQHAATAPPQAKHARA